MSPDHGSIAVLAKFEIRNLTLAVHVINIKKKVAIACCFQRSVACEELGVPHRTFEVYGFPVYALHKEAGILGNLE